MVRYGRMVHKIQTTGVHKVVKSYSHPGFKEDRVAEIV